MVQSETETEEQRPRLWRSLRGLLRLTLSLIALGLSGVLVGLLLAGWFFSEQRHVAFLEQELGRFLGVEVEIASGTLSFRQGVGVQFKTVSMQAYGTTTPFVTAERIDLVLDLKALLRGQLLFRQIFVFKPSVQFTQPIAQTEPPGLIARLFSRQWKRSAQEAEADKTPSDTNLWFSPQLSVHQIVLEDATLVLRQASTGVLVVLTRVRLQIVWEPSGGVGAQLRADLGQNGEVGQLTLRSRSAHWPSPPHSFPLEWQGDIRFQNVAVQEVGAWFGADWPSARVDFSGQYTVDLSVHQLVLEDAKLVFQRASARVPVVFTHTRLRIAWDSGGAYGEFSTDLGQDGEVGQLVLHSHVMHEELTPNASPAEWRGNIHLQNINVRELGTWFDADWPSAHVDFVGKYTGKSRTTVSGIVRVREAHLSRLTVESGSLSLTDLRWDNSPDTSSWSVVAPVAGLLENLAESPASLTFNATLKEVRGRLGKNGFPIRLTSGQVYLHDGQLSASKLEGSYGQSSTLIELGTDWGPLFSEESSTLRVRLAAQMNLADDLDSVLALVASTEREAFLPAVHRTSGQADIRLRAQLPSGRNAQLSYAATVEWHSAGMALPEWGLTLSEVNGAVHLTPEEAKLQELRFRIGTSTGVFEGTIERPFTSSRQGRVVLSIPQATVQDFVPLLDWAMVQPQVGQFRGQVEARFGPDRSQLETEGQLMLSEARVDIPSFLKPLNILRGQVSWRGQQGRFVIEQGILSGTRVTGAGEVRSLAPVDLDMTVECGELDFNSILISDLAHQEKQKTAAQNKVRVDVHCDRVQYKMFTVAPVRASVYRHDRQVDFHLEEAGVSAGHVRGEGTFWLDSSALSFAPQVSQVDTADFFAALGLPLSGILDANGNIEIASWESWNDLEEWDGELTLSVHDGVAQRLPLLIRLWTAIQLPHISREGLPFSSLTGDVVVKHGELTTKNLSFVGEAVRLDARGQVNLRQKTLDITGDIIPLRRITSAVEKVPLLGKLLAQSTDRLTTLPFQVSGSYHDPQVRLKKPLLKMNLEFD